MKERTYANTALQVAEWLTFAALLFYGFRHNHPWARYGAVVVMALTIGHNGYDAACRRQ